jgi:hypothetical protein
MAIQLNPISARGAARFRVTATAIALSSGAGSDIAVYETELVCHGLPNSIRGVSGFARGFLLMA